MKRIFTVIWLLLFATALFAESPVSVLTTLEDSSFLYDGDLSTSAAAFAGENSIVLQLGQLKYLQSVQIDFWGSVDIGTVAVFSSENFFVWEEVETLNTVQSESLTFDFSGEGAAMYVKVVFYSSLPFEIAEVSFEEAESPENVIQTPELVSVSETAATISWQTDVPSMDTFYYKKLYNGSQAALVEASYLTNHSVTISDLLPGCEYVYQIVSQSPDGTRIESELLSFETEGTAYPEFWEYGAESINPFSASFYYQSNVPTKYEIYFGESADDLESVDKSRRYEDEQDFEITDLDPETQYFIELYIWDKNEQVLKTEVLSFITPAHNIALGKDVSGTFSYDFDEITGRGYEMGSEKITDGDLNYFGGMAMSHLPESGDQYAVIDLGEVSTFKEILIYWWGLAFPTDYRIEISDDGENWETAQADLNASDGEDTRSSMGDYLVLQTVELSATARYIRIYIPTGTQVASRLPDLLTGLRYYLCEVSVIEDL